MTFWAYVIATVGFCVGMYLIFLLKKWKIGAWIACLSLAVFAGASINIQNLVSVDDAFKYQVQQQVSAISNDVGALKVQMVLTQQIVQTVNLVTEVKKEVADIRETIAQLYERTRTEQVLTTDSNKLSYLEKKDGAHVAIIRLKNVPIRQSVNALAYSGDGEQIPILPMSMSTYRNVLTVTWKSSAAGYEKLSYIVTYTLDRNETNLYDTVGIQGDELLLGGQLCVIFP